MKSHRGQATVTLSNKVLDHLEARGFTMSDVAQMIGLGVGFLKLVRERERCMTVVHLSMIAERLKMPFAAFLDEAVAYESKTPAQAEFQARVRELGRLVDESIGQIRRMRSSGSPAA